MTNLLLASTTVQLRQEKSSLGTLSSNERGGIRSIVDFVCGEVALEEHLVPKARKIRRRLLMLSCENMDGMRLGALAPASDYSKGLRKDLADVDYFFYVG